MAQCFKCQKKAKYVCGDCHLVHFCQEACVLTTNHRCEKLQELRPLLAEARGKAQESKKQKTGEAEDDVSLTDLPALALGRILDELRWEELMRFRFSTTKSTQAMVDFYIEHVRADIDTTYAPATEKQVEFLRVVKAVTTLTLDNFPSDRKVFDNLRANKKLVAMKVADSIYGRDLSQKKKLKLLEASYPDSWMAMGQIEHVRATLRILRLWLDQPYPPPNFQDLVSFDLQEPLFYNDVGTLDGMNLTALKIVELGQIKQDALSLPQLHILELTKVHPTAVDTLLAGQTQLSKVTLLSIDPALPDDLPRLTTLRSLEQIRLSEVQIGRLRMDNYTVLTNLRILDIQSTVTLLQVPPLQTLFRLSLVGSTILNEFTWIQFPITSVFPALKILNLTNSNAVKIFYLHHDTFHHWFPNLKLLQMDSYEEDPQSSLPMPPAIAMLPKLEVLSISGQNFDQVPDELLFKPSLVHLKMDRMPFIDYEALPAEVQQDEAKYVYLRPNVTFRDLTESGNIDLL